jgi:hypothetical protein
MPDRYRKQLVESRAQEHVEAERDRRRDLLLTVLTIAVWTVVGLVIMGMGIWVDDEGIGKPLWIGGRVVGMAGVAYALYKAYLRGERRGDW